MNRNFGTQTIGIQFRITTISTINTDIERLMDTYTIFQNDPVSKKNSLLCVK